MQTDTPSPPSTSRLAPVWKYVITILAVAAAAGFGSQFRPGPWYAELQRPPLAPPNWIFGPVWTVLYVVMAVVGGWVWNRPAPGRNLAMALFFTQVAFNALWSPLFFGWQRADLALIDIVLLWLTLALTIRAFANISRGAGLALLPYLAWVTFATYLNAGFWWLNR